MIFDIGQNIKLDNDKSLKNSKKIENRFQNSVSIYKIVHCFPWLKGNVEFGHWKPDISHRSEYNNTRVSTIIT